MLPLLGSVVDLLKKKGYHVFVSFNNTELEIKKTAVYITETRPFKNVDRENANK